MNEHEGVTHCVVPANGAFPNNSELPALLYHNPFDLDVSAAGESAAGTIEAVFSDTRWSGSWRNGVYPYHHYHSNAHEVLGCYSGSGVVQLGGPGGIVLEVKYGDVVVIPAGVAHMRTDSRKGFQVVGAYPDGMSPDICRENTNVERAKIAISAVPAPAYDPTGISVGVLAYLWKI